jgi:hypothetical protein
MIRLFTIGAAALATLATMSAASAQGRVQTGVLDCRGAPSAGFVVGSQRQLDCIFRSDFGPPHRYHGVVSRLGVDLGFTQQSALGWAVFAPTNRIGPGDLAGSYGGVTAGAAVGVGGNANVLIGGSNNTFALQPLSLEGQTGLNVSAGLANLQLEAVEEPEPAPVRKKRRAHKHKKTRYNG